MGLGDKFKDLKKQAQETVVEHRDQIQEAVGVVGVAADRKTKGRYTQKIAKFGQKANEAVDKVVEEEPARAQEPSASTAPGAPAEPAASEANPSPRHS
jgi:predicted lipid-binding transport protein (Tim44 family)